MGTAIKGARGRGPLVKFYASSSIIVTRGCVNSCQSACAVAIFPSISEPSVVAPVSCHLSSSSSSTSRPSCPTQPLTAFCPTRPFSSSAAWAWGHSQRRSRPKIPAAGYSEEERFLDLKSLSFGLLTLKIALKVHNEHDEQWILELSQNN